MKTIDEIIANASKEGAEKAIEQLRESNKAEVNYDKKPVNTGYFSHKFIGLNDQAKEVLAKVYLLRRTPYTDPQWLHLYKDWLIATDKKYHDQGEGLKELKTMAVYYWEKIKLGKDSLVKKDCRIPGFNSLKDYANHEIRRRTDIEYDY